MIIKYVLAGFMICFLIYVYMNWQMFKEVDRRLELLESKVKGNYKSKGELK